MTAPQFASTSTPLFKSTGVPAMNAACCCSPDCICTVPDVFAECNCVTTNYGTKLTNGDATITVTGTGTSVGRFYLQPVQCTPSTCGDIAGSYVLSCGDYVAKWIWDYVCTVYPIPSQPPYDLFVITVLILDYRIDGVFVEIYTNAVRGPAGSTNPYPTIDDFPAGGVLPSGFNYLSTANLNRVTYSWLTGSPTLVARQFVSDALCGDSCNPDQTVNECITAGSKTLSLTLQFPSVAVRGCDPSTYGVSLSVAAAS